MVVKPGWKNGQFIIVLASMTKTMRDDMMVTEDERIIVHDTQFNEVQTLSPQSTML